MAKHNKNKGLTGEQVIASRREHGSNVLTPPAREPLWKQFLHKFDDPLIKILLVALVLSVALSLYEYFRLHAGISVLFEPTGIFLAILLATLVGFLVEVNANKKFRLLNQTDDDVKVKVLREGHITQVPRRDIVVGDIVVLDTGEKVPADGTILDSFNLRVDESSFTGEPSAWKTHDADAAAQEKETTYPADMLLRASTVIEGNATMRVDRVGDKTEYGKVYRDAQIDNNIKTPLTQQLDRLGRTIARGSYVMAGLLVLGRILAFLWSGSEGFVADVQYFIETVMLAVTLIVVSVPEGLPMSVTLSLALSMRKMLKHNNLVRRMHACETMGAATVICTDKTGTLTQNKMKIYQAHFYGLDNGDKLTDDDASHIIQESIACNSTAFLDDSDPGNVTALGNPTEGALLLWLHETGIDYMAVRDASETLAQMPFSTMTKMMATVVDSTTGKRLLLVKGAPEIVMRLCNTVVGDITFQQITDELTSYQNKAMRTLAFAYCELPNDETPEQVLAGLKTGNTPDLNFLGIVAISDPVRTDVPSAIQDCRNAGVKVKIVTGDTGATAREIGRQVGLWRDDDDNNKEAIITGPDFAALDDDEAAKRAQAIKIMARARPDDKARLVRLLQQQGEVVAVTGDGTNDAPALKAAHVGLSMGDGTSVAKEASDITIIDNSFASIGRAVMWGRSLYQNIQRFILFQTTVNVCACLVVLAGAFLGTQSPLTVTQMLWVNLIMDTFAAMALASLPPTEQVMNDPPRSRQAFIISNPMWASILITGGIFTIVLLVVLWHLEKDGMPLYDLSLFFTTFVMLQFWNMFNARAFLTGQSALRLRGCKGFIFIAATIFIGQVLIVTFGGQMFNVTPLSLRHWLMIIGGTSIVLWIGELVRLVIKKTRMCTA